MITKLFDEIKEVEDLHHAYFFVGDQEGVKKEILNFLDQKLKVRKSGNPDFNILNFENLSVDEARGIREASEKKNYSERMFFIISFESISHEAQNSLLKVVEEPTKNTHFIFISPQDNLLPTLKSRMEIVKSLKFTPLQNSNFASGFKVENDAESILKLNLKQRLERVKEIVEAISDEDSTKQEAIDFVNQVEDELYILGPEKARSGLDLCQKSRVYLLDRGAPVKMILENLVLNI